MKVTPSIKPETGLVLTVALAAMLDISGRVVRNGSVALTKNRSHEQGKANLDALRRMVPLTGLAFIAMLAVILLVCLVTGNQYIGVVLAIALYALPIGAIRRVRTLIAS